MKKPGDYPTAALDHHEDQGTILQTVYEAIILILYTFILCSNEICDQIW